MSLAYPVGGAVTAVSVSAASTVTAIPTLNAGGGRPRFLVVQIESTVKGWVTTGTPGTVMDAADQGMLLQRDSGDLVLKVPKGHTHINIWASGAGTVILTPLSARPS